MSSRTAGDGVACGHIEEVNGTEKVRIRLHADSDDRRRARDSSGLNDVEADAITAPTRLNRPGNALGALRKSAREMAISQFPSALPASNQGIRVKTRVRDYSADTLDKHRPCV